MRKRVAQDILSYIESLVNCYLMNLFAISAFPQGMQLVRFVELPRGVEGFRHRSMTLAVKAGLLSIWMFCGVLN